MASWDELWDLVKKSAAAAVAVYLAVLCLRFSDFLADYVARRAKDEVMALLMEYNLKDDELIKAQKALNVLVDLLNHEWQKAKDEKSRKLLLESIEIENYDLFKNALYGYFKKDVPLDEIREIVKELIKLRSCVSIFKISSKGSYELPASFALLVRDLVIKLRELRFFIFIELYSILPKIIVPAPYMDMDILKAFEGRV